MKKKEAFCEHKVHRSIPCLMCRNMLLLKANEKREREEAIKRTIERAEKLDW